MCLIVKVRDLASWTVIDFGTGNGLLQELAKQGCWFVECGLILQLITDVHR
ncbi:hypothetical protein HanRHA438_Chr04g0195181 [Helianthus annuus]|uniref:Uncharacterized protein n=1 Tax=Helianthus annuus TaxID=4232 RepID=A0A251V4G7_HELAN|nr:hypothetical protein HanXRQr2_Chr04g0185491 [Helianthus annuus]KAJ0590645.1 hypothetical protein HanIR_Chr04g0199801 [Helianthus annuus]KAJ0928535.1 hypothetical protein HanRHA438_Chr04g0195181 [Helianthus annuus]KAJ0932906.1 hypothetical protein HanPSC8_Chr04g0179041 [Helianthus annuus]